MLRPDPCDRDEAVEARDDKIALPQGFYRDLPGRRQDAGTAAIADKFKSNTVGIEVVE